VLADRDDVVGDRKDDGTHSANATIAVDDRRTAALRWTRRSAVERRPVGSLELSCAFRGGRRRKSRISPGAAVAGGGELCGKA